MESQQNPIIVEDVEEGDLPELPVFESDEITDRVQILSDLKSTVVEEGVSRDDIEAMNNVLHGFSQTAAVESYLFTQQRSPMNVQLALEAIDGGIIAAIKRWIQVLVKYVRDFATRFKREFNRGRMRAKITRLEDATDNIDELNGTIHDLTMELQDAGVIDDSYLATFKDKAAQQVDAVSGKTKSYQLPFDPQIEHDFFKSIMGWIDFLSTPIDVNAIAKSGSPIKIDEEAFATVQSNAKVLATYKEGLVRPLTELVDFDGAVRANFPGTVAPSTWGKLISDFEDAVDVLQKSVDAINKLYSRPTEDIVTPEVNESLAKLNQVVSLFAEVDAGLRDYVTVMFNVRKLALKYQCELIKQLYERAKEVNLDSLTRLTTRVKTAMGNVKRTMSSFG